MDADCQWAWRCLGHSACLCAKIEYDRWSIQLLMLLICAQLPLTGLARLGQATISDGARGAGAARWTNCHSGIHPGSRSTVSCGRISCSAVSCAARSRASRHSLGRVDRAGAGITMCSETRGELSSMIVQLLSDSSHGVCRQHSAASSGNDPKTPTDSKSQCATAGSQKASKRRATMRDEVITGALYESGDTSVSRLRIENNHQRRAGSLGNPLFISICILHSEMEKRCNRNFWGEWVTVKCGNWPWICRSALLR